MMQEVSAFKVTTAMYRFCSTPLFWLAPLAELNIPLFVHRLADDKPAITNTQ
jgi:hypothetical protein